MFIPNPTARLGEDIAARYLQKENYKIIERNFRKGYGEIDIIAINNNVLVFFEVKTRTTGFFGGAIESISSKKIKKLISTAQFYKSLHSNLPGSLRIDAILIDIEGTKITNFQHIKDITS